MRTTFSRQYNKPCIIIEPGDTFEDISALAEDEGAIFYDGPDPVEDKCYVVKFLDSYIELYTINALKRSLPREAG